MRHPDTELALAIALGEVDPEAEPLNGYESDSGEAGRGVGADDDDAGADPEADRPQGSDEADESWQPIDLGPVLAGDHEPRLPEVLVSADGSSALFYRGAVNGIHGDSGIGKSWVALLAAAQELGEGRAVVYVDFEADAVEVVERLRALGATDDAIAAHLVYFSPQSPAGFSAVEALVATVVAHRAGLVVLDSLGEAFSLEGADENKDVEVGPWLRRVARRVADVGPALVLVDHSTKAADNPLHPSGSKRKRAAVTGASYLVTTTRPPTRTDGGTLTLTCAKDRHGTYARGKAAATVDVTPWPDGGVTASVNLAAPTEAGSPDGLVMVAARAVVRAVRDEGRAMSRREILAMAKVTASTDLKRGAIDLAVGRGCLAVEKGARGAQMHTYLKDFETKENPPSE